MYIMNVNIRNTNFKVVGSYSTNWFYKNCVNKNFE